MISATEILRLILETDDTGKAKLLWHLYSFSTSKAKQDCFHREMRQWFPEMFKALEASGCNRNILEAAFASQQRCSIDYRCEKPLRSILPLHLERSEKEAREKFYLTNIGAAVWETLDWCLEEQHACFIQGLQGRGKSASAKAWCEAHRGQARYASLDGFATQRNFFSALADAYGATYTHAKAPNEIRFRVQDIIVRSGLMLVIDEAHFALPERTQHGRPAIIDWINTALCNNGVPVALISTPQFGPRLSEFENRTTYNADQFKRRFSRRWHQLDENTSEDHLAALAKKTLPNVGQKGIELAASYAGGFGRDVSALFDLVADAERRARKAGHPAVTFQDLRDAYSLDRIPSENAIATAFAKTKRLAVKKESAEQQSPAELPHASTRTGTEIFTDGTRRQELETNTK